MNTWNELRFWYSSRLPASSIYRYKREILLPVLRANAIEHFLLLDEPEFMLLRILTEAEVLAILRTSFEGTLAPLFSRITVEVWSPSDDARNRILSAKR